MLLEKCTPPNIHSRQILLVSSLQNQFIHMAVNGKRDRLSRQQASELVAHRFQDSLWCIWDIWVRPPLLILKLAGR